MTKKPVYVLRGNKGEKPQDGSASALAGVAERGDRVQVFGLGEFVNVGSKEEPIWKPYTPEKPFYYPLAEVDL